MRILKLFFIWLLLLSSMTVWSQTHYFIPCNEGETLIKQVVGQLPSTPHCCHFSTELDVTYPNQHVPFVPTFGTLPKPSWLSVYRGSGNYAVLKFNFTNLHVDTLITAKQFKIPVWPFEKFKGILCASNCVPDKIGNWRSFYVTREHPTNNPGAVLNSTQSTVIKGRDFPMIWKTNLPTSVEQLELYLDGKFIGYYAGNNVFNEAGNPIDIPTDTLTPGSHVFTGHFTNACGTTFTDTCNVDVLGTCAGDPSADITLTGSGAVEVLSGYPDGGYRILPDTVYTVTVYNITDFEENYSVTHNGGSDITLTSIDDTTFQLVNTANFGSFRISFIEDSILAQGCKRILDLKAFVKGNDVEITHECAVVLPDFLDGYLKDPDVFTDYVITDFNVKVTSGKNIVVKPGVKLVRGAQLTLNEFDLFPVDADSNLNFTQTIAYDDYGRIIGGGRSYFDKRGRSIQVQTANMSTNHVMVGQTLYDHYDRPSLSTLPAPHKISSGVDACGDSVEITGEFKYEFHRTFIQSALTANPYEAKDFESLDTLGDIIAGNPVAVLDTSMGTLGWYYSDNNSLEPHVPTTSFPFVVTEYYNDGSGDAKSSIPPGDVYRDSTGHKFVSVSNREKVDTNDVFITDWLYMRNNEVFPNDSNPPAHLVANTFRVVATDPNGKKAVSYQDMSGKTIIACNLGSDTTNSDTICSYNFYNDRGWLMVSVTPNGVAAYDSVPYDSLDKTTYTYNHQGWLLKVEEPDAGFAKYKYRRDGSLRFSQNALQADSGWYSYTNYDRTGRPVESGEYHPGDIEFDSITTTILESTTASGGLTGGEKTEVVKTHYDRVGQNAPITQEFVRGGVSWTEKVGVSKTWYSYDERSRVTATAQYINGLDLNKVIEYGYNAAGNVQEVAYQRGEDDAFYHYYEYDKDQRLKKVYTGTVAPTYDEQLEITNLASLDKQAEYFYYIHGPLKRVEIDDTLQGIDYVYTIEGWLKSINHPTDTIDPGGDGTNGFVADVFGMTLEYYNGDYTRTGTSIESVYLADTTYTPGYGGNIRGMTMRTSKPSVATGFTDNPTMYAFSYDDRYQLTSAAWGTPDFATDSFTVSGTQAFEVSGLDYDYNGNILGLQRRDDEGTVTDNFLGKYVYAPNKNQLTEVTGYASYTYNSIGQLTTENRSTGMDKHIDYNVSGLVTRVADSLNPRVLFAYDENGLRLSKTVLNEQGDSVATTWYIRDNGGQIMGIYEQDHIGTAGLYRKEVPIYGNGRIGIWQDNADLEQAEYLATMEDAEETEEEQYFLNLDSCRVPVPDFLNHTSAGSGKAMRLNNIHDGGAEGYTIGGAIALSVNPGDTIQAEVFVKYVDHDYNDTLTNQTPITNINNEISASGALGEGGGLAGGTFISGLLNMLLTEGDDDEEEIPEAYLNYVLFDKNLQVTNSGFIQVSDAGRVDSADYESQPFEKLAFSSIPIEKSGYIYVYVTSESLHDVDVYFDDMKVTHSTAPSYQYQLTDHLGNVRAVIEKGADESSLFRDYFPFGLEMQSWTDGLAYRYGFQGEFAEYDTTTEWNAFELRMYDSRVARWISIDPARQFASPYLAMGNSPVNNVDPDGAFAGWFKNDKGDIVYDESINSQEDLDAQGINGTYLFDAGNILVRGDLLGKGINVYDVHLGSDGSISIADETGPMTASLRPGTADYLGIGPNTLSDNKAIAEVQKAMVQADMVTFGLSGVISGPTKVLANVTVYVSRSGNTFKYIGITSNLARRAAAHLAQKGIQIEPLIANLTRSDARAVEQALIQTYKLGKDGGPLLNKINSISLKNPIYRQSVERGFEILKQNGINLF